MRRERKGKTMKVDLMSRRRGRRFGFVPMSLLGAFFAVVLLVANDGLAQKKPGGGVIQLEEITIEGKIQKPNAFYILERQGLGFTIIELKTSFLENIIAPVGKSPF